MKKFSILGLVLLAASAVTSAFIPSKGETKKDGKLVLGGTCRQVQIGGAGTFRTDCQPRAAADSCVTTANPNTGQGVTGTSATNANGDCTHFN